jgi:hypothetical protein
MNWIRAHRYSVALMAAAVLVLIVGFMTKNDLGKRPERGDVKNISVDYPYYAPPITEFGTTIGKEREILENPAQNTGGSAPIVLRFVNTRPKEDPPLQQTARLVTPKVAQQAPAETESPFLNDSYFAFFQALSRMLSPADTRTAEQKLLHDYGNTLGSIIRDFETAHTEVVQTLKTFFDSRTDTSKAAGIPKVADAYAQLKAASSATTQPVSATAAAANLQIAANDYVQLSTAIAGLNNIPPQAEILNAKLAKGYADVAEGFSRLTKSENDAQLLEAINTYNATAEEFIRNYVALVTLFSAYGVKFSSSDPGAIFSFSATGGL